MAKVESVGKTAFFLLNKMVNVKILLVPLILGVNYKNGKLER